LDLDGFRKIDGFAWMVGMRLWHERCSKFGEGPRISITGAIRDLTDRGNLKRKIGEK